MNFDLRTERMNRGLSLDALSKQIDVPRNTISRVENGATPVPETRLKLAEFYGKKVTEIWPVDEKAAA